LMYLLLLSVVVTISDMVYNVFNTGRWCFRYYFLHTWLNGKALLNYFTFCRLFSCQQNDSSIVSIRD
jgi:hypothetical protein